MATWRLTVEWACTGSSALLSSAPCHPRALVQYLRHVKRVSFQEL